MDNVTPIGSFLTNTALFAFGVALLITGGLGTLGIILVSALTLGSGLQVGSSGYNGCRYIYRYFSSRRKKNQVKLDEKKPNVGTNAVPVSA